VTKAKTATKKPTAEERARVRLRAAIDRACLARGEAQWTNGYRTGVSRWVPEEGDRLFAKEMAQFRACGVVERTMERAIRAYAEAVARRGWPKGKRRSSGGQL
jgi:hypothetical protein